VARVLLIDDDADIRAVLTLTLRRAGLEVAAAVDGADALDKLAAELPDVIVLDVMMPRMDGFETLRRIRGQPRTAHLPVLMLTAKAQLADRMAGFERGADDYVAKPFEPTELVARVRSLLKRTEQTRLTSPLLEVLGEWSGAEGLAQLGRDLEAAREIQSRLLPKVPERVAGLEAAALLYPSSVLSGDFFDLVPMGDRIGLVVGDVSGKGVSAALLMIMVRTLLREIARGVEEPAAVLSRLNGSLCREMPPAMFVTVVLVALDPTEPGRLILANGGHPPPVLVRGGSPSALAVDGMMIGAFTDATFDQVETELAPGDACVIFTDGAVEGGKRPARHGGMERLFEILKAEDSGSAAALARAVADDARRRVETGLRDDLTVVALKR
jgi:sigma-B regulation protein RsbU (phosphoserine phosphatase)